MPELIAAILSLFIGTHTPNCPHTKRAKVLAHAAAKTSQPMLVAALCFVESSGRADAVSSKGAIGLCQIMPDTQAANGFTRKQLFDPEISATLASRWLAIKERECKGDIAGALSRYSGLHDCKSSAYSRRVLKTKRRLER